MRNLALVLALMGLAGCLPKTSLGPPNVPADGGDSSAGAGDDGDAVIGDPTPPCPLPDIHGAEIARTTRGLVEGESLGDGLHGFLGLPFAEPPVGDRRLRPPEPHACWADVRPAKAYGASCLQNLVATVGDEDCLTLNVWTPEVGESASPRPVLFWIYGGAEIVGGSDQALVFGNLYDGADIARRQHVVVVSINYRLAGLGFLAHPALSAESPHGVSGNYGLLDLILGLRWVRENIRSFGGDPERVMIFGESAGAWNVCMLLSSPLASGLFQAAAMQSGSCAAVPLATREATGVELAADLGCAGEADVAGCLRAQPATAFLAPLSSMPSTGSDMTQTWQNIPFGPTLDGYVIPEPPLARMRAGRHNRVPLIVGTNEDETELFLLTGNSPITCYGYETMVEEGLPAGADLEQALALYPCTDYLLPRWAAVDFSSDAVFRCEARRIARAASLTQPTFRYLFTHGFSYGFQWLLQSFHAAELPFLFGNGLTMGYVTTPGEDTMGRAMQSYWAHLAGSGAPNVAASPYWEPYDGGRDNLLVIDTDMSAAEGTKIAQCDFWDSLVP